MADQITQEITCAPPPGMTNIQMIDTSLTDGQTQNGQIQKTQDVKKRLESFLATLNLKSHKHLTGGKGKKPMKNNPKKLDSPPKAPKNTHTQPSPNGGANELTPHQKKQAIRAFAFKVNKPIRQGPSTLVIDRKLNSIIKQLNRLTSAIKHKTSTRKRTKKAKHCVNCSKNQKSNKPDLKVVMHYPEEIPKKLRSSSLYQACQKINMVNRAVATQEVVDMKSLPGMNEEEFQSIYGYIADNSDKFGDLCTSTEKFNTSVGVTSLQADLSDSDEDFLDASSDDDYGDGTAGREWG